MHLSGSQQFSSLARDFQTLPSSSVGLASLKSILILLLLNSLPAQASKKEKVEESYMSRRNGKI